MALYCFRMFVAVLFVGLLAALVVQCMDETRKEHAPTLHNYLKILYRLVGLPLLCLLIFLFDAEKFGFWDHAAFYVVCGMSFLLEVLFFAKDRF